MQTLQLQFESMTECPGPGPSWRLSCSQICSLFPLPPRDRQQLSNFPTRLSLSFSLSLFLPKLRATNSSRNFCVKVHIENVPATNLLPPSLILLVLVFVVNELPEKETQKFRQTRHSFVTFSLRRRVLHKTQKNEKKKKTWRTSLREGGGRGAALWGLAVY